ncbi:MAG: chemotaxis response regulator protein-glutamate methylesterase [Deltaproteobacteria bacterium]|nr:chemotaxis response regulator protein-glutamate methylesterase [Deltaproteobacteria bacterium]
MVRVLVVDDSAFMRKALSKMLEADPEIQVVGTARDGFEALEKVAALDPDLVTLDVDMPRLGGLETLQRLMAEFPRPVVMVSSMTSEGAEITLQALDLGALDYLPKQIDGNLLDIVRLERTLCEKVKTLARRRVRPSTGRPPPVPPPRPVPTPLRPASPSTETRASVRRLGPARLVVVGASTGGPPALQTFFSGLSSGFPTSVVVVQHMPKAFTGPFAKRLSQAGPLEVKEAESGDRLEPGRGFVAPGGTHLVVRREGGGLVLHLSDQPADSIHKPSVDVMFRSFADVVGGGVLAVVLTGMGSDGLEGVRSLKAKGCSAIAQDAESCVVFGMPRAIVEAGLADAVLPMGRIASAVEGALE